MRQTYLSPARLPSRKTERDGLSASTALSKAGPKRPRSWLQRGFKVRPVLRDDILRFAAMSATGPGAPALTRISLETTFCVSAL